MEEASNGKVEKVAETGDERKEGVFEGHGEYNYKVEVQPMRGESVVDGNSGEATETQRENEAKDDEEEDDEKVKKEEKIVPLAEEEKSVAQSGAVSVEHAVTEEAATEDSDKVDAAAVEQEEETEVEIPSAETPNGVVLMAGAEETAPVAVDESDVVVPVVEAAAEAEEMATEEPVLAEEEEKEGDSTPAAADMAPKESGGDPSLAQLLADAPPISEGGIGTEHGVDKGDIPESTGSPPIVSVSRRSVPPTSWRSCCGLFDVLRRCDR